MMGPMTPPAERRPRGTRDSLPADLGPAADGVPGRGGGRRAAGVRARMTGPQRREQLLDVGRKLFAEKGFEGTSVEEIAARAEVSKPVVYEHFGGKEGLYAVVVDREIRALLAEITGALTSGGSARVLV